MIESRITSKGQTTVPRAVRAALGLHEGERVAYEIEGDRVVLTRVKASLDPFENPFAMFTEWADEIDCEAFDNL
ncbi:AbrB/MazE/SpoVT family DNA-binding domain-containing protein [Sphingomonas bacterium]|uniref:AbrB/MazE/SpoVT family DNA-binding domain-containing protein n=1 Tax=Sphingomonas bacterium TaxID=1895847 RepID=UPI0015750BDA|nr:type II toxin-antitoxin system PrlF family antitoxin [Sphingomonas bacterium]